MKVRYSSNLKRDEVALYLNELSKGFLEESLPLMVGNEEIMLDTSDTVRLEVEANGEKVILMPLNRLKSPMRRSSVRL